MNMDETIKKKNIIKMVNWINIIRVLASSLICSIIGMALPETIARLNNYNISYGIWASYLVAILLFYVINFEESVINKEDKK